MAAQKLDESTLIGLNFGLLTVKKSWREGKNIMVDCLCKCGKRWVGRYANLKERSTKSCGCRAKAGRDGWRKFSIKSGF